MASVTSPAFERAMRLAVVTGLRCALGPALVAAAQNRPERRNLAMAALGEMVVDKLPLVPSRSALPLMLPRALAGAWVARTVMEEAGEADHPWAVPLGAAVAAGVATLAPKLRAVLETTLGLPDFTVGLAEDYLALRLGGEAVGLSMDQIGELARGSLDDLKEAVRPALDSLQSVAAGSM